MKKIMVITRHCVKNYGSILQTYAFVNFLRKLKFDVSIINFRTNSDKNKKGDFLKLISYKFQNLIFAKFYKQIPMTQDYDTETLFNVPPKADIYCTGSDQVWNDDLNNEYQGFEPAYFLEFTKDKKCISYAASFGKENFNEEQLNLIAGFCRKYSAISVREESGVRILEQAGIENAAQVLDPTLLFTKNEWLNLAHPIKLKSKYILVYHLYGGHRELFNIAKYLSKKNGLRIVHIALYLHHYIYILNGKVIFLPKVEQFISYFSNAEYVVTNSFHGIAFSINLNKQFFAVYPKVNIARISSILKLMGLMNRCITRLSEIDNELNKPINYNIVNKILESERDKSIAFLKNALEN